MATNTYTNIDVEELLNATIESFQTEYPDIRAFSSTHEMGPVMEGDKIRPRTVQKAPAAEDYDAAKGYDVSAYTQGQSTIAVDITANKRLFGGFYVDDDDIAKRRTPAAEWARSVHSQIHAGLIDYLTTGITAAAYGSAGLTSTADNFDLADLTTLKRACNALDIPKGERVLVVSDDYITELASASGLEDISSSGDRTPLYEGNVTYLKGFEIVEMNDVNGNSQNLVGWAGSKKAIQVGTGQLGDPRRDLTGMPMVDNGEFIAYIQDMEINGVSSGLGLNVFICRESLKRRTHYTFQWFGGHVKLTSTQLGTHPLTRIISS